MTESRWNPEKPLVIIAICIIGIINAIQMINLVLSPMSKQVGAIYPLYFSPVRGTQPNLHRRIVASKTLGCTCFWRIINL